MQRLQSHVKRYLTGHKVSTPSVSYIRSRGSTFQTSDCESSHFRFFMMLDCTGEHSQLVIVHNYIICKSMFIRAQTRSSVCVETPTAIHRYLVDRSGSESVFCVVPMQNKRMSEVRGILQSISA